ncbi:MAG: protein kinase [Nannocystaceae bacterium]
MPLLRETIARASGRPHDVTRPGDSMAAIAETVASASSTLRGPIVVTDPGRPRGSAPGAEAIPREIGRFAVLRRLGAGGMGTVYAAYDDELARKVAIKVLHVDAFPTAHRGMLVAEARAMARLSHPHVVQVHELGEHPGGIFLVMEYVEGPTLDVWLQAAGRSWESILRMFVAAGEGLAAAHEAGLVHRDFKPDNVLIAAGETPKVADFGLARPGDQGTQGQIAGTPLYMSPEQHLGEPVGPRSDLFSFCVALYGALYDQAPFAGESLAELRESVTEGALRPPPAGAAVPARVHAALVRGLARDLDDRWPSMKALLEALRAALPRGRSPWATRLAFGAVGAALAAAAVVVLLRPASPSPAALAAITEGSLVAHASAGAAEWIYPGDRDPARTAIRRVVDLEHVQGPAAEFARRQADRLRKGFGDELAALGDRYWEDPRTRAYARDFYAQALVFLPEHPVALKRGNFTPGQLAELRDHAVAGDFTPEQLAAVAPLKILADLDDPDLQAKIAALGDACDPPQAPPDGALAAAGVAGTRGPGDFAPAEAPTGREDPAEAVTRPDVTPPDDPAPEAASASPEPSPVAPRSPRPLGGVDALIAQAENARRQGKDDEAARLFHQALGLSPRDPTSVAALSDIAFDRGDYREAESLAGRAIKLAPDIGEHRTRRGDARFKLGDSAGARADFEKALALGDHRARRRLDLLGEAPP